MSKKTFPLSKEQLEEIIKKYPTPFHIYDERAIRENIRKLQLTADFLYGLHASASSSPSRRCRTRASCRSCTKKVLARTTAASPSSCSRKRRATRARRSC